jgi:hypothetical protein
MARQARPPRPDRMAMPGGREIAGIVMAVDLR